MRLKLLSKLMPCFCLILLFCFQSGTAHAASKRTVGSEGRKAVSEITGRVTDAKGIPLPGVTVIVKGTKTAASTDVNGKYKIRADENSVLVFTMIGFGSKEVRVDRQSTVNVILQESSQAMEEVVVVGYGTQKKRDLTGAISSVKSEDLVMSSNPDVGHMLKGKVAGLMIRENSAQPGGGIDILIRGAGSILASNAPLIVVDGFPISDLQQPDAGGRYQAGTQSVLNSFNPNDIESIDVLKDASATAIYGSRAANGVILITTKRGKAGTPVVQYSTSYSYQKYNNSFDVLPLNEWMQVRNEAAWEQWNFDNNVFPYGSRTLEEAQADPVNGPFHTLYTQNAIDNVGRGTDWLALVTRDGNTRQHNLSLKNTGVVKLKDGKGGNSVEELYKNESEASGYVAVDVPGVKGVEVYVFEGPELLNVLQRYNLFSGGGALPALWGLGVKYRVKGDFNQRQVGKMADYFRTNKIPCDVLGLEPKWQTSPTHVRMFGMKISSLRMISL